MILKLIFGIISMTSFMSWLMVAALVVPISLLGKLVEMPIGYLFDLLVDNAREIAIAY